MSQLSELPKLSDAFVTHIKDHNPVKNDWMPCPRCGSSNVEPPGGRNMLFGGLVGFACIVPAFGCLAIAVGAVGVLLFGLIMLPVAALILIPGIALAVLLTMSGNVYRCKPCGYSWKFRDIGNLKNQWDASISASASASTNTNADKGGQKRKRAK